ncbi:carbohydrate kinase family protein [Solemya velesiana gill symbiont]|uniref:Carbohydrate kinase n=1 Tax=Solemya velesiana gill symbiont TaxID=1918948 RepID=A0A1T2KS02_9GAMM|nr:carbohydrate kinase [Solemya velesiana gill symbiont]OOZ35644.1 carbohydrate kinase [Solemya velesiana gill symbiont]
MNPHHLCIFGEVLYDIFPGDKRVLGGAPFNVAWHLQAFTADPLFISRVGDAPLGREIRQRMLSWGMDTSGLQLDSSHPTGEVKITLAEGEPSYDIVSHRAYDYIDADALPPVLPGLIYHGSLALRNRESRQALSQLRVRNECRVFLDVNLRSPWWQKNEVLEMVANAHWVKLNEHELTDLSEGAVSLREQAIRFKQAHGLEGLVVTQGGEGAFALGKEEEFAEIAPPQVLVVVDTVGAGDAFASVLILGLSRGWPLQQTLERAQAFASQLVGRRGATVEEREFYRPFLEDWSL